MLNNVFLGGRATRDIELRRTEKGTPVVQFSLAVENRLNKDENGKPAADFINCLAWNKVAETISKYVKKGNRILIIGRLQTRNYENKEGNKVYVTEVVVENVKLIDYADSKEEKSTVYEPQVYNNDETEKKENIFNITEDDLPF